MAKTKFSQILSSLNTRWTYWYT